MQEKESKKSIDRIANSKIISGLVIVGIFLVHKAWLVIFSFVTHSHVHAHAILVGTILAIMVGLAYFYKQAIDSYREFSNLAGHLDHHLPDFDGNSSVAATHLEVDRAKVITVKDGKKAVASEKEGLKELPF